MDEMKKKIICEDLTIHFGDIAAIRGLNLHVYANEILSIIGPANSGKSSFLIAINRMVDRVIGSKVEGKILIDGSDINKLEDVEGLRRRIGMVFAMPNPLPMSIRDNILFGPRLVRIVARAESDAIVERTLKSAFLWDEVKDRLDLSGLSLSGGQQQRLCIARALALEPDIILFDEPCSGLDPISTAKVEDALKILKERHTIVLVTNNTKQAARVGDRTAFILMGELIEIDRTDRIFTSPKNSKTEEYITGKFG